MAAAEATHFSLHRNVLAPDRPGREPRIMAAEGVGERRHAGGLHGQSSTVAVCTAKAPGGGLGKVHRIARAPDATRLLTLNGIAREPGRPLAILLSNSTWLRLEDTTGSAITGSKQIDGADDPRLPYATELPRVGATEIWRFANITAGGHPVHLHLIQFQLLDRTPFDPACYRAVYNAAFETGS